MLISMTGFGQGEASNKEHTVSVEIRTVNHRFLDYSFKLPRMLNAHERDMKEQIRKQITRGRIYVTVSVESETAGRNVTVNAPVMERYLEQLKAFATAHGIEGSVDINTLAQYSLPLPEGRNVVASFVGRVFTTLEAGVKMHYLFSI